MNCVAVDRAAIEEDPGVPGMASISLPILLRAYRTRVLRDLAVLLTALMVVRPC